MKPVGTAEQARTSDREVIESVGVPGIALMELASRAVASHVVERYPDVAQRGVVVVCGGGNNGGDGYGCARWLHLWGVPVRTWSVSTSSSGDALVMRRACARVGVPEVTKVDSRALVVDALFGTGLSRAISGEYSEVVNAMNQANDVVAVDIPSGLCADSGAVLGCCVRARSTVTFGFLKRGFFGEPGADYVGEVVVADIGLSAAGAIEGLSLIEAADCKAIWPRRSASAHKGKSGHLLVIAGSAQMAGAAVLVCKAALRAGAGLVTLVSSRGAYPRLKQLEPAVMVVFGGDEDHVEFIPEDAVSRADAVVCGPGLAGGEAISEPLTNALRRLWSSSPLPIVFDADALSVLMDEPGGPRVITPHPGEAARLLNVRSVDVQRNRFESLKRLVDFDATVVLKGRYTLVGDKQCSSINPTGGPVLATAGSGDVLCGVIGALLARGLNCTDSARLGAFVHGLSGDMLESIRTEGWSASDIVEGIPSAIQRILDGCEMEVV